MKRPFQVQTLHDDGKTWWRSGNPNATQDAAIAKAQTQKAMFKREFDSDVKFRVVNLDTKKPVWEEENS